MNFLEGIFVRLGGTKKVVILVLLGVSVLSSGWAWWQIYGIGGYRQEIYGLSGWVATDQAMHDFRAGKLRLMKLAGENKELTFSGQQEGPFEIWHPQYFPSLGVGHRYHTELYIKFYNRKMKYMYEHPEKFLQKAQDDANQPVGKP